LQKTALTWKSRNKRVLKSFFNSTKEKCVCDQNQFLKEKKRMPRLYKMIENFENVLVS